MNGQISIASIILQESGTYSPQYSRPYEVVSTAERVNTLGLLEERIGQITRNNPTAEITPGFLSGIASGLVVPAASFDKALVIPNGWSERRLRFLMEVHISGELSTRIYYFQGYTDYLGVSMQGSVDPNMTLFVNSYIQVSRTMDPGSPTGYSDRVIQACQLINGTFHAIHGETVYGLRPEDIFTGIQSNYLHPSLSNYIDGEVLDVRINKANEVLQSRRSNEIPSNYLAKAIAGHRSSQALADFGNDFGDIFSRSIQTSFEGTSFENPFLRAIANVKGIPTVTSFTMNDLQAIDPTVSTRTSYHKLAATTRLHQQGDTDDNWSASTLATQIATMVTHAVSALMIDCMLVRADVHATTYTMDGQPVVNVGEGFQSVCNSNMAAYLSMFMNRFKTEVMPDITLNGQINVDLRIRADLYGESYVEVSVEGGSYELFVTPSFCDAIMSTVVTTNRQNYHDLVNGIEEVVNYAVGSSPSLVNQNFMYETGAISNNV